VITKLHVNAPHRRVHFEQPQDITTGGSCQLSVIMDTRTLKITKSDDDAPVDTDFSVFKREDTDLPVYETEDDIRARKMKARPKTDFDFRIYNMEVGDLSSVFIGNSDMFSDDIKIKAKSGSYVAVKRDFDNCEMFLVGDARTRLNGMFKHTVISLSSGADVKCHSIVSKLCVDSVGRNCTADISTMPDCVIETYGDCDGVRVWPIEGYDDDDEPSAAAATAATPVPAPDGTAIADVADQLYHGFAQRALGGFSGPRDFLCIDTSPEQVDVERRLIRAFFGDRSSVGGLGIRFSGPVPPLPFSLPPGILDDIANQTFLSNQQRRPEPRERHGRKVGEIEMPADEDEEEFLHSDEVDDDKAGEEPPHKKRKTEEKPKKRVLPAGEKFCITCESRSAKVAFAPCGHCDLCIKCSYEAMRHDHQSRCPTCMDPVTSAVRVYR